jgi:hypothetical protein
MQLFSEQVCRTRSGSEEAVLIGRILAGRKSYSMSCSNRTCRSLASKARPGADIVQSDDGAIVAQGAAILE